MTRWFISRRVKEARGLTDCLKWRIRAHVEEKRLQGAHIDAPNMKWVFEDHLMVEVRRIEDPQLPLRVGVGLLPNWLRHKKGLIALDHYDDELCVFRCIAVHQGARKDRNRRRAQELVESFSLLTTSQIVR